MKQVKELLSKPMTRQQFLQFAGMALLSLVGASNFIAFLLKNNHQTTRPTDLGKTPTTHGVGSRKFGESVAYADPSTPPHN